MTTITETRRPSRGFGRGLIRRAFVGGNVKDGSRLPRYIALALFGGTMIWAPITGYLKTAPLSFKSQTSLILPGSGSSASLNLNNIGQASSYSNSAFASNSVSPTETYKRLLGADRILAAAAESLNIPMKALGRPRVDLVNQTSLIHFEISGPSPEAAQDRGNAILSAFFTELDALRADEQFTRQDSGRQAIADYQSSVSATRRDIETLKAESGLLSPEQYERRLARFDELETVIQQRRAELGDKTAAVAGLEARLGVDAAAAAATLKLFADDAYLALVAEASDTAVTLADALSRYGKNHPKVQAARAAHQSVKTAAHERAAAATGLDTQTLAALDLAPEGARADLLAQLVRMEADKAGLMQEIETIEATMMQEHQLLMRAAPVAAQLQDLERDFAVAEAVFASAIARNQTSKSDVFMSYPLVQVLENPSKPDEPSSPNRKLAVAAGGAATFMLLLGLAMGWIRKALIRRLLVQDAEA